MVPGRSKKVFKTWLASQPHTWRSRIEIVAMDGFTGFKSAAAEELPDAKAVMDPLPRRTPRRQRLGRVPQTHRARTPPPARARHGPPLQGPQDTCTPDPAYSHRVSSTKSSTYSPAIATSHSRSPGAPTRTSPDTYRSSNARGGKTIMHEEIMRLTSTSVPSSLTELITLGRTLKRRTTDILAYFDHPHTSNGPTEAINGRLEHQRSCAPGLSETSPTTSPEHSPKQENSNPNYTPNYEEPPKRPRARTPLPCFPCVSGDDPYIGGVNGW